VHKSWWVFFSQWISRVSKMFNCKWGYLL